MRVEFDELVNYESFVEELNMAGIDFTPYDFDYAVEFSESDWRAYEEEIRSLVSDYAGFFRPK